MTSVFLPVFIGSYVADIVKTAINFSIMTLRVWIGLDWAVSPPTQYRLYWR